MKEALEFGLQGTKQAIEPGRRALGAPVMDPCGPATPP
jgi:hypothetical protein